MKVKVNKKFLKDLAGIPSNERARIETFVFDEIINLKSITSSGYFKKLKGFKNYYRVRFGEYRIGVSYKNDFLIIESVLHRKEIYKFFP